MSKIFLLLTLSFVILFVYPQVFGVVKAAPTLGITPKQITNKNPDGVDMKASNLFANKQYIIVLSDQPNTNIMSSTTKILVRGDTDSNGEISVHLCPTGGPNYWDIDVTDKCKGNTFQEGNYYFTIFDNVTPLVISLLKVIVETAGRIDFKNTSFKTIDDIKIIVSGINKGSYKILVDGKDPASGGLCVDAQGSSFEYNLGKYLEGSYNIQIYTNSYQLGFDTRRCGPGQFVTHRSFTISNSEQGGPGPVIGVGITSPTGSTIIKQCKSKDDPTFNKKYDMVCTLGGGEPCDNTGDNRGPAFKTAIGCVHTNPAEFVKDFMKWVLGIGGGLSFLMMLMGAFQMLTSAGNPETLNAGKDRLTSAIIGLLMVIFAILLLQIIGVGILKIPGFK